MDQEQPEMPPEQEPMGGNEQMYDQMEGEQPMPE